MEICPSLQNHEHLSDLNSQDIRNFFSSFNYDENGDLVNSRKETKPQTFAITIFNLQDLDATPMMLQETLEEFGSYNNTDKVIVLKNDAQTLVTTDVFMNQPLSVSPMRTNSHFYTSDDEIIEICEIPKTVESSITEEIVCADNSYLYTPPSSVKCEFEANSIESKNQKGKSGRPRMPSTPTMPLVGKNAKRLKNNFASRRYRHKTADIQSKLGRKLEKVGLRNTKLEDKHKKMTKVIDTLKLFLKPCS